MLLMMVMEVAPGFLGALFCGSGGCELAFSAQSLSYGKAGQKVSGLPLEAITVATAKVGMIWSTITISTSNQTIALNGVVNSRASHFIGVLRSAIGQAMLDAITRHEPELQQVAAGIFSLLSGPRYLSHRDIETWKSRIADTNHELLARILPIFGNSLLPREKLSAKTRACLDLLVDAMSGTQDQIKRRNERFVTDEIVRCKEFFDGVEKTPLTKEQRIASVVFEDRNLLVAAAGSGKTSTIVGKIGYALLTKQYAPKDFLVLAFNSDAAAELDERINATLVPSCRTVCGLMPKPSTRLGLKSWPPPRERNPRWLTPQKAEDPRTPCLWCGSCGNAFEAIAAFAADWVMFRTVCFKPARNPAEFESLVTGMSLFGPKADYSDGKRGFLTIQGEIVKSQGELAIANWLYVHGVEYEYERPYEYDTADQSSPSVPAGFLLSSNQDLS